MKLQLLLFFAVVFPIVLFLATIIYGNTSTISLKKAITDSGAYSHIASQFAQVDADTIAKYNTYDVFVSQLLTSTYFQTKIESAIDDSANWITGKTQTPPVISFKELKEELQTKDIILLKSLIHIPTSAELKKSGLNTQDQAAYLNQAKELSAFANTDFNFPLENQLEGIRLVYSILQIAIPILIVFLLCSLFFLITMANSLPMKFKWVGATLLTSSFVGYDFILFHSYFISAIMATSLLQELNAYPLFSPIIPAIINHYVDIYVGYQELVSILFLVGAGICFLGAFLSRKQAIPKIKPVYEVRSYWETPLKEEQPQD